MFTEKDEFICCRIFSILIILFFVLPSFSTATDIQSFPDDGLENTKIEWFRTLQFFGDSENVDVMDPTTVKEYHEKIDQILDTGKILIGAMNSWIFPQFAGSQKVPGEEMHMGTRVALTDAVPPFNSTEYKRLVGVRSQMFKSIAEEFPEVDIWLIGYEGNYVFQDLNGRDLDLDSYVTFLLDTLESSSHVIREANRDAVIIAHFIGRWESPVMIAEEPVQPRQIINLINERIQVRGGEESKYFDQMIVDLVPSLTDDRGMEDGIVEELADTRGDEIRSRYDFYRTRSVGWNQKWSYPFSFSTVDLADLTGWKDYRGPSSVKKTNVQVYSGEAICDLEDGTGYSLVVAGAETDGIIVVPTSAEFDDDFSQKDYWKAVMDFDPIDPTTDSNSDPSDPEEHIGVFLRVNDRTWNSNPDQTRFGTIVYTKDRMDGPCQDNNDARPCGAVQFTGDYSDDTGGWSYMYWFHIENGRPFDDNENHEWQLVIYERKVIQIGLDR